MRVILVGLVLMLLPPLRGHGADVAEANYFQRHWSSDDGLPENSVTAVVQTGDGYLWLATYAGLARFDGVHFTIFNSANTPGLQSDRLTSLFEDAHGDLWIGHERGDLTRYHAGTFESLAMHETGARRKICAIEADAAGDIWILNEEGTLVRVRDGISCSLPNNVGIAAMARDVSGQLWVASGGELAPLMHNQLLPLTDSGTNGFAGYYVTGICASHDGGLWIVSDGQVRRWKNKQWVEDLGTNPCPTTLTAMIETRSGMVAMGSVESGLYLLRPQAERLHFSQTNGFPHDWIRCLCEDREGTLWAGAGNGGLVALRHGKVQMYEPPDHWQGRVPLSTAVTHDGAVWVTTEGAGLYQYLNGSWNHFDTSSGLSNVFVWCVSEDARKQLWAGTWGNGMFVLKDGRFVMPLGLENIRVPMAALYQAPDGVTWIGSASGLIRYRNGAVKTYGEKEGLKVPDVRAITETPDGSIWFGTLGGGLGRLANGRIKQFTRADGLASDYVQSLHVDVEGTLWIGTYGGGMSRLKSGRFTSLTSENGLPSNFICGIAEDGLGNLWISSSGGISRIAISALNGYADAGQPFQCLTYDRSDGMFTEKCSGGLQPASCQTADGRLWFTTSKGLAVVDPAETSRSARPAPVVIEEMLADGRTPPAGAANGGPLQIPPGWQRFEFHYTALSFIAPDKIQFQYRLDGWEKTWVDANTKRVAEYNFLPPGHYVFHARARNHDGTWGDDDASVAFVVLPHFWQTWWFYLLSSLLAVGLVARIVWSVSRRRMRRKLEAAERQQAIERERTRIAKDIHDHLGANLTRISLLSQSAHGDLDHSSPAAVQLDRIYDTSRELTRSMDEIVWAVNPQHDTLDSLASYLGNFAQEYLVSLGIRCRLEVPLQLPHWPISAEMRHNVFLAFKEALHNVVKHAQAREVSVYLNPHESGFNVTVRDDGKGFDPGAVPERPGRGNGLKNMRQRLEKIGGHCEIHSSPGAGTEIRFFIQVPEIVRGGERLNLAD
jgi:signal transduction histidine kinase/ligand-binding sensor domain-containing protein